MTQQEFLQEFKQMPIREQLEMLRAALQIVESKFEDQPTTAVNKVVSDEDPLFALAGSIESTVTNVGERHDFYIGESLQDDHS